MKKLVNLIGQLRIYSLVDLVVLILAIGADFKQGLGILLLHIGFLLFLEQRHSHKYRVAFPKALWAIVGIVGVVLFPSYYAIGFITFSYLYTRKNRESGLLSPLFRGLQVSFLVTGVISLFSPLLYIVFVLSMIRNFLGDVRDVSKDKKEGIRTLPMILGFKKSYKHIHLVAVLVTTSVWWYFSSINAIWLVPIILLEIFTYNLTPR